MQFTQVVILATVLVVVPIIAIKCNVGEGTFYDNQEHNVNTRKQDCQGGSYCEKEVISINNMMKVSYTCPLMNNQFGAMNKCVRGEGCYPNNQGGSPAYTCCCKGNYCNSATSSKIASVLFFAISWLFYKYH